MPTTDLDPLDKPTIIVDESGQTGEHLLDPEQPVFALASIRADAADLEAAVTSALAKTQMLELKFSRLAKGGRGRATILSLLGALSLKELDAAVAVYDKGWMAAAKLVDELVEPTMLKAGLQHTPARVVRERRRPRDGRARVSLGADGIGAGLHETH